MTDEQFKQLTEIQDELILKAVQSGKQETSGLVDLIIHKQEPAIKQAIRQHVNGQFDMFRKEFKDYVEKDTKDKEAILKWQKDVTPAIEAMEKFQGFTSTSGWILKGVLLTGGVIGMLWGAFVFIKNQIKHL